MAATPPPYRRFGLLSIGGWLIIGLLLLVYLPSLLVYLIAPAAWWPMGLLSIGFPFTWLAFVIAVFIGWLLNKRLGAILFIAWLLGLPMMANVVGMKPQKPWQFQKAANSLRIMQWNCMELAGTLKDDSSALVRKQIRQFIALYQPDIIVLQDFQEIKNPWQHSNIAFLQDTLRYAHVALAPFFEVQRPWGQIAEGSAIFSKIPFTATGQQPYKGRPYSEKILWADVVWQHQPLRIISSHFLSMNLNTPKGSPNIIDYHQQTDSAIITSGNVLTKLRYYQSYHVQQAEQLRRFIQSTPHSTVLGIDMNSVPTAYVYRQLATLLQDAWLQAGWGLGATYHRSRLPHLRIDYLMAHPLLRLQQIALLKVPFSDHYPILADYSWR